MVIECTCQHRFQDETYGTGKRYAVRMKNDRQCRCTVCGRVAEVRTDDSKAKK